VDPVTRSIVANAIRRIEHAADALADTNPDLVDYLGKIANDLETALDRPAPGP
jgi:hypothetical protein